MQSTNDAAYMCHLAIFIDLRKSLLDLAARGCAILIISQDLDEIFEICDRIAVLYQGTLSPLINTESASVDQIGLLMGGKTTE